MKVYILTEIRIYEEGEYDFTQTTILGVYSTYVSAEDMKDKLTSVNKEYHVSYNIKEYEVEY